jgi:transcriptional regulator with XRE-family HTH domain
MAVSSQYRQELAHFLRSARARVRPSDIGLPSGARRRTAGLRREEVAMLAEIGVTWYTRLEQGAEINASLSVLKNIARALQLTEYEREHLFLLGGHRPTEPTVSETEHVSELMQRVLDALDPNPAIIRGRRYDVLAWNRAAVEIFGDYAAMDKYRRNSLWRFFMCPDECAMILPRREELAPRIVAQFRSVAAKYIDEPCFKRLIDDLTERSPEFRRYWSKHEVVGPSDGFKYLRHPQFGEMTLEYTALAVPEYPDMKLIVYTATPGSREETQLRSLLGATA